MCSLWNGPSAKCLGALYPGYELESYSKRTLILTSCRWPKWVRSCERLARTRRRATWRSWYGKHLCHEDGHHNHLDEEGCHHESWELTPPVRRCSPRTAKEAQMLASLLRPFSLSSRWSSHTISPPGGCQVLSQAWFHWLSKFLQILCFWHSVLFYCFSSLCMEVVQSLSTFTLITLWVEPV